MEEKKDTSIDCLIVGCGPTGMTLALQLHNYGLRCRVIDKHTRQELAHLQEHTRAVSYQPLTSDIFQMMGLWPEIDSKSFTVTEVNLFYRGPHPDNLVLHIPATDIPSVHFATKARPFVWSLSQNEITDTMEAKLNRDGLHVELGVELLDFTETEDGVHVVTQPRDGTKEEFSVKYLLAADGVHSFIRGKLAIPYDGFTYEGSWSLMDIKRPDWQYSKERQRQYGYYCHPEFTVFNSPIREGRDRMMIRRFSQMQKKEDLPESFPVAMKKLGWTPDEAVAKIEDQTCASVFQIHNRCARKWHSTRKDGSIGRIFLVGDAAHTNSPGLGQGMNLGIQDAVNLSWKLAMVIQNKAKPDILKTFYPEREPQSKHARATVKFVEDSLKLVRNIVIRNIMKRAIKWRRARSIFSQFLNGYKAFYYKSPLSLSDHAPARAFKPGTKLLLSNPDFQPGLHLECYAPAIVTVTDASNNEISSTPVSVSSETKQSTTGDASPSTVSTTSSTSTSCSSSSPSTTTNQVQKHVYIPVADSTLQMNYPTFLQQLWSKSEKGVSHSLYIFQSGKSNDFLSAVSSTFNPHDVRTYYIVPENHQLDLTSISGHVVVVDVGLGLHTLFGMTQGGFVFVRPDDYVSYVSGRAEPSQLKAGKGGGPFRRFLDQYFHITSES